jgi:hypothetical protein
MNGMISKGMRVRAEWIDTKLVALAGVQMKAEGTRRFVEGVVTHVRGDHPTNPTKIGIWVQPDEGDEVVVNPEWIVGVFDENGTNP